MVLSGVEAELAKPPTPRIYTCLPTMQAACKCAMARLRLSSVPIQASVQLRVSYT
jgi:hypothetical protein